MQSIGLSVSVYLSAAQFPLQSKAAPSLPLSSRPAAPEVSGSTSIQLRRAVEPEVDSTPSAVAVRPPPAAVLDHGDPPSKPSGSGESDPMPSSPSSSEAGSLSRPSPPSRSVNPTPGRGTAGSVDRNPPTPPPRWFQTSTSGSGSDCSGGNPAPRRNSSPPLEIMTSGKPRDVDDAGFVQGQPTSVVAEGRSMLPGAAGPEGERIVDPRCCCCCCCTRHSISRRARSTLSGAPTTSKTGSVPRDGVTMYVCVSCWIRFTVEPFGPTTSPTDLTGTRTYTAGRKCRPIDTCIELCQINAIKPAALKTAKHHHHHQSITYSFNSRIWHTQ